MTICNRSSEQKKKKKQCTRKIKYQKIRGPVRIIDCFSPSFVSSLNLHTSVLFHGNTIYIGVTIARLGEFYSYGTEISPLLSKNGNVRFT